MFIITVKSAHILNFSPKSNLWDSTVYATYEAAQKEAAFITRLGYTPTIVRLIPEEKEA